MRFNIARLIQHQVRQGISGEVAILIIEHVFISLSHVFFYFLNTQIQYYYIGLLFVSLLNLLLFSRICIRWQLLKGSLNSVLWHYKLD
jgi:aromatic ring hydroxylase